MKNISAQSVIEMYYAQKPVLIWEVGEDIMPKIRNLKDETRHYLCIQSFPDGCDTALLTLLGHKVKVISGDGIRLVVQ